MATQTGCIAFDNLSAVQEAAKVIDNYGQENISQKILEISLYMASELSSLPVKINSYRENMKNISGTINFIPMDKNINTSDLVKKLYKEKIYVNDRKGIIRASTHFYNNKEDIDLFI